MIHAGAKPCTMLDRWTDSDNGESSSSIIVKCGIVKCLITHSDYTRVSVVDTSTSC